MGHGRHVTSSSVEVPVVTPVADYNVTGTVWPDARCNYFSSGTYNEHTYYKRDDDAYFLFYAEIGGWYISAVLGDTENGGWLASQPGIVGEYEAQPPAYGFAFVAAGPHEEIVADYHVTGNMEPPCVGNYKIAGLALGEPYYVEVLGGVWFLWGTDIENHYISDELGSTEDSWKRLLPDIVGDYLPQGSYIGTATVVAGPC